MKLSKHDREMRNLEHKVRRSAKRKAQSPAVQRRLAKHLVQGTTPYACANFDIRCLNVGSEQGRECNYTHAEGEKICPHRVIRPNSAARECVATQRRIAANMKVLMAVIAKGPPSCSRCGLKKRC